jgi:hypothetical protein
MCQGFITDRDYRYASIAVHTWRIPMAIVRRRHRSEWFEYLPYWLIIAIVIFEIASALWMINRMPDLAEVRDLPNVQVRDLMLPEISVHPNPSGKLR